MNAYLLAAQQALEARRSGRQDSKRAQAVSAQHKDLSLAYVPNGSDDKGPRFFLIRYCSDCLRGTTLDLIRDVPAGTPDGRELGLKQMRPWRLECPEASRN